MCSDGGGGTSPSCDVNTLEVDCDGDDANNEDELACGTDPADPTSTILGTALDCDGDGKNNEDELACGSDPNDPTSTILGDAIDCDGDGANNEDELACGSDPADPTSTILGNATDCDSDGVSNAEDVDDDNDGLIEILSLEMLNNIRYDLDGTHYDTDADDSAGKEGSNAGCLNNTCQGYELVQDLNFDENNNGQADDTYNQNAGWLPIAHKIDESIAIVRDFRCVATVSLDLSGTSMTMPSQCPSNSQPNTIRAGSLDPDDQNYPCGNSISATLTSKSGSTITVALRMGLPANDLREKTVSCSGGTSVDLSYTDENEVSQTIAGIDTIIRISEDEERTVNIATYTYPSTFDVNATPSFVGDKFEGTFEGNNFAIQNLSINRPFDTYVGLFGYVGLNGVIRNLKISGKANVIGLSAVALVAGHNDGTIEKITLDITQPSSTSEANLCATTKFSTATTLIGEAVGAGNAVSNLINTQGPRIEKTSFQADGTKVASDCDN